MYPRPTSSSNAARRFGVPTLRSSNNLLPSLRSATRTCPFDSSSHRTCKAPRHATCRTIASSGGSKQVSPNPIISRRDPFWVLCASSPQQSNPEFPFTFALGLFGCYLQSSTTFRSSAKVLAKSRLSTCTLSGTTRLHPRGLRLRRSMCLLRDCHRAPTPYLHPHTLSARRTPYPSPCASLPPSPRLAWRA